MNKKIINKLKEKLSNTKNLVFIEYTFNNEWYLNSL